MIYLFIIIIIIIIIVIINALLGSVAVGDGESFLGTFLGPRAAAGDQSGRQAACGLALARPAALAGGWIIGVEAFVFVGCRVRDL